MFAPPVEAPEAQPRLRSGPGTLFPSMGARGRDQDLWGEDMAESSSAFESALLVLDILIWRQIRAPQYLNINPELTDVRVCLK
jgi:hypothetical protein